MKSPIAALALVLALAPAACRSTSGGSAPVEVAFTTLAMGSQRHDAGAPSVIRTAAGLERQWAKVAAPGAAPQVDFARHMVLFAPDGAVERVVVDSGFLRVELAAGSGGYHFVRITHSEAPVQFVSTR